MFAKLGRAAGSAAVQALDQRLQQRRRVGQRRQARLLDAHLDHDLRAQAVRRIS